MSFELKQSIEDLWSCSRGLSSHGAIESLAALQSGLADGVFRVSTGSGQYVVKHSNKSIDYLNARNSLFLHCQTDVVVQPMFIEGSQWIEHNGRIFEVFRYQDNNQPWTVDACRRVGVELGLVHARLKQAPFSRHFSRLKMLPEDWSSWSAELSNAKSSLDPAENDALTLAILLQEFLDTNFEMFAALEIALKDASSTTQLTHGDFHQENILLSELGIRFVDLDKVMYAPAVFDISKIIALNFSNLGCHTSEAFVDALLKGYSSVIPVTSDDVRLLSLLIPAFQLNGHWALMRYAIHGEKQWARYFSGYIDRIRSGVFSDKYRTDWMERLSGSVTR